MLEKILCTDIDNTVRLHKKKEKKKDRNTILFGTNVYSTLASLIIRGEVDNIQYKINRAPIMEYFSLILLMQPET